MSEKVNLDALIPREDFEVKDERGQSVGNSKTTIAINDVKRGEFFFEALRKPDFQRETNEWDSQKICEFIKSFLFGDLIPAIILWRNAGGYSFIIDGSHRISALAAWVNDDYGDGDISKQFYEGIIPDEQIEVAEKTRLLVRKTVGSFKDHQWALSDPSKVKSEIIERAKSLGALAIQLQWVSGDSSKAESSFFNINQQASPINTTELRILKARRKPNGLAARAIVRSGRGHKYWSAFSPETQLSIQDYAKEIHQLLFMPRLDLPIKTLDLPIGGKIYSAQSLPLILDFINIVNKVSAKPDKAMDDTDGSLTIQYLSRCRTVARRINSNHPSSLGLHPIVYFYSQGGRHKIASFFAITALMLEFDEKNMFAAFSSVRAEFEQILLTEDYLVQQIVRKGRSALGSYEQIKDFYLFCIRKLCGGATREQIISDVVGEPSFSYLTPQADFIENITRTDFSRETKSAAFVREAVVNALKCNICGGYIHRNSISIDHIKRKSEGGLGSLDNAQLTHPYCNSTLKQ
jgi:hypothetical protein